jgi:hypothetical protein
MAFSSITKHLRDGIMAMLEDDSAGFNATLALAATAYSITPFDLDFSPESNNFFQGRISEMQLEDSTYFDQQQIACLYTINALDGSDPLRMLNNTFSGVVTLGFDIYLMYQQDSALRDFETLADAVTDTMYSVFSGQNQALWPVRTTRRWEMRSDRERVEMAGTNWMQCIRFEIPFEVSL